MSKIRSTGISSLYLAQQTNAQPKNLKQNLHFLSMDMFTSYGHIKKPRENYRLFDFDLIYASEPNNTAH